MKEAIKQFVIFWRDVHSDAGERSWSRVIGSLMGIVIAWAIVFIIRHLFDLPADKLGLWLSALPWVVGSLAGLLSAPYLVNKGGGIIDVLSSFANRQKQ